MNRPCYCNVCLLSGCLAFLVIRPTPIKQRHLYGIIFHNLYDIGWWCTQCNIHGSLFHLRRWSAYFTLLFIRANNLRLNWVITLYRIWQSNSEQLIQQATSTVYWCIASKLNVPLFFLWNEQNIFVCWFINVQSVLFWRYYNDKEPTGYWRYHSRCQLSGYHGTRRGAWHHTPWAMSLYFKFWCNIFLAFKWILMMRSGQNISHYTTAKPSVPVWNHDLIWWQNKIDTEKHFHKTTITSS